MFTLTFAATPSQSMHSSHSGWVGWVLGFIGFMCMFPHVDLSLLGLMPWCPHGAWPCMAAQGHVSSCNVSQGPNQSYPI